MVLHHEVVHGELWRKAGRQFVPLRVAKFNFQEPGQVRVDFLRVLLKLRDSCED